MRKTLMLTVLSGSVLSLSVLRNQPLPERSPMPAGASEFTFVNPAGSAESVPMVDDSAKRKLTNPDAISGIDPKLTRAATIAEERANAHSKSLCWRYVKDALVASGAVSSRPETAFAKQAGDELVKRYGFKKIDVTDPYSAPVGSVLVYDAKGAPGHVEIRTANGFASDFRTKTPSRRPLLGVFVKA